MTDFGTLPDGQNITAHRISAGDISVTILSHGAIVHDLRLRGVDHTLTPGGQSLDDYLGRYKHHGSLIGPIANRISTGRVRISGIMYELERNQDGRIHLHSGKDGTHLQNWTVADTSPSSVSLQLVMPDGIAGLPGQRMVKVTYTVTAPATLTMTVTGSSYGTTMMNFANHSYWNLDGSDNWRGHQLQIHADSYLPTTADSVPTGEVCDVAGTQMDFRTPRELIPGAPALDHNFCTSTTRQALRDVATLRGQNGITLTMASTEAGLQIYDGRTSETPYQGIALEAQNWPDAPNHRGFPTIRVEDGEEYQQVTSWRLSR